MGSGVMKYCSDVIMLEVAVLQVVLLKHGQGWARAQLLSLNWPVAHSMDKELWLPAASAPSGPFKQIWPTFS
jgi:hypothetical protein